MKCVIFFTLNIGCFQKEGGAQYRERTRTCEINEVLSIFKLDSGGQIDSLCGDIYIYIQIPERKREQKDKD